MAGYKKPCNYCGILIDPHTNVCPHCSKVNPLGPLRCPKCKAPIKKAFKTCGQCGLVLEVKCPTCEKMTFFGDYCEHCDARLTVVCKRRKCKTEQPPLGDKCIKCEKPL